VKVEHILGHHVQDVQASCLGGVLVMNCTKRAHLYFDACAASCLGKLDRAVGAHAVVLGWVWQVELELIGRYFFYSYLCSLSVALFLYCACSKHSCEIKHHTCGTCPFELLKAISTYKYDNLHNT
jgi:hypothetical protein